MASPQKKNRKVEMVDTNNNNNNNENIISRLPDDILCRILSFVSTRESVRTGVLSKRWNGLWTSVPSLHLCCDELINPTTKNHYNFLDVVDKIFSHHKVPFLEKLHLCLDENNGDNSNGRVDSWIISAIVMRNVKELELILHFEKNPIYLFPGALSTWKKLVSLSLCSGVCLIVPDRIDLPCLEKLSLNSVLFFCNKDLENLLSGCVIITKLCVVSEERDNEKMLNLCFSTFTMSSLHTVCEVVIEAPNFKYLALSNKKSENDLSSLVKVKLEVLPHTGSKDIDFYTDKMSQLLEKISNVKDLQLRLGIDIFKFLDKTLIDNLPTFHNLTRLELEASFDCIWLVLSALLQCAPYLVALTYKKRNTISHQYCYWYGPDCLPKCLLSHLEHITIIGMEECEAEMEMVGYFLQNSKVLKKMSMKSYESIQTQVLMFPKGSSTCQIEFL